MTRTVLESATKTVIIGFDEPFCVIGERINPTGRKKLAAELEAGDFSTVERDALEQVACGLVEQCHVYLGAAEPPRAEQSAESAADDQDLGALVVHGQEAIGRKIRRTGNDESSHDEVTDAMDAKQSASRPAALIGGRTCSLSQWRANGTPDEDDNCE